MVYDINTKIEKIYWNDKNAQGVPYINKRTKKPYKLVNIYVPVNAISDTDFQGSISYLDNDGYTSEWKEEDVIVGTVTKKIDGPKIYWNYSPIHVEPEKPIAPPPVVKQEDKPFQDVPEQAKALVSIASSLEIIADHLLANYPEDSDKKLPF